MTVLPISTADEMARATLTAVYDLEICPMSFDFCCFLALAELARRRQALDHLHIVIVPSAETKFRDDGTAYTLSNKAWRLHNILLASCALIDTPVSVTVCHRRSEANFVDSIAEDRLFPAGYTLAEPTADFLWSGISTAAACGEDLPSFRSSDAATAQIRDWIAGRSGGKHIVTITLRESTNVPSRNSDLDAWGAFARQIDPEKYLPVVIRDTQEANRPTPPALNGIVQCNMASLHLDLRLALYEQSYLNLFVMNGPSILCSLNPGIRYLMFKLLTPDSLNTTPIYYASIGLDPGGQYPHATPYQRLVWEPDNLDVIEREFSAMVERIGDEPLDDIPAPAPENREDPLEVALRLQMTGRLEEATAIYQDIVGEDPNNADAWHLLGLIAHQADRPEAAEKMILRAIGLTGGQANYFVNLAAVLKKSGRPDEAANCLWRAIAMSPNDAGAHADLAELLAETSHGDKAKSAMLKALKLKPDSIELCERAGQLFHNAGDIEIAANLYRQALELREKAAQRHVEAKEHLPELPVQTLKTA